MVSECPLSLVFNDPDRVHRLGGPSRLSSVSRHSARCVHAITARDFGKSLATLGSHWQLWEVTGR
jgi:hypothetical protein